MKKIVLTGGGTAGHVMPNIALLKYLDDFEVHYIGSLQGIEKDILSAYPNVTYHGIHTGKLRRYLSGQNIKDFFNVVKGSYESTRLLKQIRPDIIFSKGGYVAVPVAYGAKKCHIPLITHESDMTLGLANKIIAKVACLVLTTFPETAALIEDGKGKYSGPPIRPDLFDGDRQRGLDFLGFNGDKPVLLVTGGSTGSTRINEAVYAAVSRLCERFDVVHLCGGKKMIKLENPPENYRQYPFVSKEISDVFACTDYVLTRGGSNAICELAALKKPMLIVPLEKASRGDQVLNAKSFVKRGMAIMLGEEDMTPETILEKLDELVQKKDSLVEAMAAQNFQNGVEVIYNEIVAELKRRGIE